MEQCSFLISIFKGTKIGYYSGNPLLVFDDMAILKPTFLVTVPRILNKIHSKVYEDVAKMNCTKKNLFNKAVKTKTHNFKTKG